MHGQAGAPQAARAQGRSRAPLRFDPARYDAWYTRPLGRYCLGLETAAVLRALHPAPGQLLVEVGAGTGRFAAAAAGLGAHVAATDPAPHMAAWAARHGPGGGPVFWAAAWGQQLPFPSASFNAAFTVTALCFAPEHEAIVREMVRVVRPGGRVVLGELNALAPWQLWRRLKALAPGSPYRRARFHTVAGLRRMLRDGGLEDVRHEALLHWLPLGSPWLLRWAPRVERWGRRLVPGLGAFVVVSGTRPGGGEGASAP